MLVGPDQHVAQRGNVLPRNPPTMLDRVRGAQTHAWGTLIPMPTDFRPFLWLLLLGVPLNVYFFTKGAGSCADGGDPKIILPALIFFGVSAYRCLFPNRYEGNVVFHDTKLSASLPTRILATFSEVAYIYQFSHVIRVLNVNEIGWIDALSWLMVVAVGISQFFVWSAILTNRLRLYVYEELGWAVLFAANTIASGYLYATTSLSSARDGLLLLSLGFGFVYLPWQFIHLRSLWLNAGANESEDEASEPMTLALIKRNAAHALHKRKPSTLSGDWGGAIGLTWMTAYWASLIPLWIHHVVRVLGTT